MCCAALFACTSDEPEQDVNAVESIEFGTKEVSLNVFEEKLLGINVKPYSAEQTTKISWSTSNPKIVELLEPTADDLRFTTPGCESLFIRIKALAAGEVTITATTEDGSLQATCYVTVEYVPVEYIYFETKEVEITEGKTKGLTLIVCPRNATNVNITVDTVDSAVSIEEVRPYYISDGKEYWCTYITVKGLKVGKATVTATAEDGAWKDNCVVTVVKNNAVDFGR